MRLSISTDGRQQRRCRLLSCWLLLFLLACFLRVRAICHYPRRYLPEFEGSDFISETGEAIPLTIEHCFVHANGLQDTSDIAASSLAEKVQNMAASGLRFVSLPLLMHSSP